MPKNDLLPMTGDDSEDLHATRRVAWRALAELEEIKDTLKAGLANFHQAQQFCDRAIEALSGLEKRR